MALGGQGGREGGTEEGTEEGREEWKGRRAKLEVVIEMKKTAVKAKKKKKNRSSCM